ncbi:TIGR04255 family protein [Ectopseudomonas toyotomiensis]|uniref:TIGR04255 family protein n=1 Tax=Ectopseudomonas toyotomiensis TaxID=554344 RepID=A0A1I5N6I1_9GAMM|nr:TIGR04255 family protein [Pseudomonas toyotomiensis]SFP17334.1 TIGR04255 family protein [Pseudomonas toyotomiensis]
MQFEKVCYLDPFLKEAIVRIDFPEPCPALTERLSNKLTKTALSKFPISEPHKFQTQELKFTGQEFSSNSREMTQWVFHGKDREKALIINPDHVAHTNKSYKSYESFSNDFLSFVSALKEAQPDQVVNRIGIRYVNVIDLKEGNPLEWSEYINERMLGIIDLGYKENISRAFHILELNFDSMNLKCQFGIANPDYPATVKRRQFVLDLDASAVGAFDLDEIEKVIKSGHEKIQDFFENSITDKTRKLMKPAK